MNEPVLVRSSMKTWDLLLLVGFGIAAVIGGYVTCELGWKLEGIVALVAGVFGAFLGAAALQFRVLRRQWIEVEDNSFRLIDRMGEADYQIASVSGLALRTKTNYQQGIEQSTSRTLSIWLDHSDPRSSSEPILLKTTWNVGDIDPLSPFIEQLNQHVLGRVNETIDRGKEFFSDEWSVEGEMLTFSKWHGTQEIPFDEIAMVGTVDESLCVWKVGQAEVWGRIPSHSKNATVLRTLIDERLADRSLPGIKNEKESGLGRVLFERKSSQATMIGTGLLGVVALGIGIGIFFVGGPNNRDVQFTVSITSVLISIACFLGLWHCKVSKFRCYERGLVKQGIRGSRTVVYEHLEAFTYTAVRMHYHGAYTGTMFVLDFEPIADQKSNRIKYSVTLRNADAELNNLRNQVAGIIANQMKQRILEGKEVVWTSNLRFSGNSLIYRPVGFFGRRSPIAVPLTEIATYKLNETDCFLYSHSELKPIVKESVNTRNFYPGLYCLLNLINTKEESAA